VERCDLKAQFGGDTLTVGALQSTVRLTSAASQFDLSACTVYLRRCKLMHGRDLDLLALCFTMLQLLHPGSGAAPQG
jgi:hypothetical protein